jgi:hypothetical protein
MRQITSTRVAPLQPPVPCGGRPLFFQNVRVRRRHRDRRDQQAPRWLGDRCAVVLGDCDGDLLGAPSLAWRRAPASRKGRDPISACRRHAVAARTCSARGEQKSSFRGHPHLLHCPPGELGRDCRFGPSRSRRSSQTTGSGREPEVPRDGGSGSGRGSYEAPDLLKGAASSRRPNSIFGALWPDAKRAGRRWRV